MPSPATPPTRRPILSALVPLALALAPNLERQALEGADPPIERADVAAASEADATGHWAFRPVRRPSLPVVEDGGWPRAPIDLFVLGRLEARDMRPAPAADRPTLIRRAYLDLLGLPPPPDVLDAVARDPREDWFEALVDRLLAAPQYGERWARYWLDVARYNDGFGSGFDGGDKPEAWRYRDWVVDSLNADLPYDRFVWLQIAGDHAPDDPAAGVATGFLALGPTYKSDGGDPDAVAKAKADTLEDRVDTTFRGMQALTVACARCHDHKFDPIPIEDYYALAGVFNNTRELMQPVAAAEVVRRFEEHKRAVGDLDKQIKSRAEELKKKEAAGEGATESAEEVASLRAELDALRARLEELKKSAPPKPETAHAVADGGAAHMHVALRGDLRKRGDLVPRRFLTALGGAKGATWNDGSGRVQLADAIASPDNPLTARVIVNRLWMHHFGEAIVRTPSNFGTLGEPPTHPALLDWLAWRLMESGWSIKELHRDIMLSATYRMSSRFNAEHDRVDGDNRLLWRMSPRRLDVEAWRDSLLAVTGELDLRVGGPPTRELLRDRRRTLYSVVSRNGDRFESDRFLRLFDFPAARITSERRQISTVPQQYLFMLNSPFLIERARQLAGRLEREATDARSRIERAYRLLHGRSPTTAEADTGLAFVEAAGGEAAAWQQYAQVLLASHEFIQIR